MAAAAGFGAYKIEASPADVFPEAERFGPIVAALGGGLAALAIREAALAAPGAGHWLAAAVEPLRRAGREGRDPTELERRRLALVGTIATFGAGPPTAQLTPMNATTATADDATNDATAVGFDDQPIDRLHT